MFEWISLAVASAALFVTLWVALVQSRLAREQRVREFELAYVQRYWSIRDRMSHELAHESALIRRSKSDLKAIADYLELCEDEIDVRKAGRISDETWAFWSDSVRAAVTDPRFTAVWADLSRIDGRFAGLREAALSAPGWDPCPLSARERKRRGLRPDTSPFERSTTSS